MGKISERMNMLEKDCFKTLMAFLPEGTFSSMGTFTGASDAEIVPGLDTKSVMNMAVNILAICEEASEALDKIEELEKKLDKMMEVLTILVGQNKNEFTELGTRFDGLEESVRSSAKKTTKEKKEEKEG